MPEGDTIHQAAGRVGAAIAGQPLLEVDLPRIRTSPPRPGVVVERVESRGKYLLVHLDDGHTIVTHLKMTGVWRVLPADRPPPPRSRLRVWLRTESAAAACLDAPIAQLVDMPALSRHPGLRALGPDLCDADPDLDAVVQRAARFAVAGSAVGELLLDQRVAAGIGNVYKSEVAFLHGLHPSTPVDQVDQRQRRELFVTAHELLRRNLRTSERTTVPGRRPGSLWVYARAGRPCRRCGTPIEQHRTGRDPRATYWCPTCQPPPVS